MRTLTALASLVLCAGCATLEGFMQNDEPYLQQVLGPNVWVRVPKALADDGLEQAIDVSAVVAIEHCETRGDDMGTHFVAADTAVMDKSEYSVTWRCCRSDDECCFKPKSKACE